ncbi:MAG: SDR family oxidoreductase [Polyangiaceae bacterium]|nr:SDR family oxidoreductase [Polyangiaceae bacterium]
MPNSRFTEARVPDLAGQIVIVTGANSGLGFETARVLAAHHALVVMAGRNRERCDAARDRIRAVHPAARIEVALLDLANLSSVRRFAREFAENHPRVDVLCNNAGVMATPLVRTADGFELQLGTNHFGPFALTGLLLPLLLASPVARVVTVSSPMHRPGTIPFDDLDGQVRYRKWRAYCASKLANLLFAFELDRRARVAGVALTSVAAHPGYAATNLQFASTRAMGPVERWVLAVGHLLFAQSAPRGALPQLYAATMPGVAGGEYFGPRGPFELWGAPRRVGASARAQNAEDARRLWELSVERTGVTYPALANSLPREGGPRPSPPSVVP